MYSIRVEANFSSAHNLRGYKGKCESLHGHNWEIEVEVASVKLDKIGMVLDFRKVKNKLGRITEKLDHKYLNNLAFFKKVNPTSENLARYIYEQMCTLGIEPKTVTVRESENSSATYSRE